ncbi:MAG TPA: hypothetical protein VHB54_02075 [Mucilaginibacter sp.]|nr:hypothetical protein [Mucilaginibacter sp.]
MQAYRICGIEGLKLKENDRSIIYADFILTEGRDIVSNCFSDPAFSKIIGSYNLKRIVSNPYFFSTDQYQENTDFFEVTNKGISMTQELITFLWFVKDNSCNASKIFTYVPELNGSVVSIEKPTNFSNCHASYSDVEFSSEEILKAAEILYTAHQLSSANKHVDINSFFKVNKVNAGLATSPALQIKYSLRNRVERAILFLITARAAGFIPMKIALYMNILECLFSDTSQGDIIHKISERVAFYIGESFNERIGIFKKIKEAYVLRSKYFHGQKLDHKIYNDVTLPELATDIDNLMRSVLIKVIMVNHKEFTASDENIGIWFNKMIFDRN